MPVVRGELCIGLATFLSFVSVVLLIFIHVGQINTTTIPRGIAMVKVNVSEYGNALLTAQGDPIDGLYTSNASAPLAQEIGLRQLYLWGFYSYCAYVQPQQGVCSNTSIGHALQPFDAIVADVPFKFQIETLFIVQSNSFTNSGLLASLSRAGFYLCFIATILVALAMFLGIKKGNLTFFLSSIMSILATLMILTSAAIWTAILLKCESVNKQQIQSNITGSSPVPLGIKVTPGSGLWLLWASFVTLFLSTIPYATSCLTYRG